MKAKPGSMAPDLVAAALALLSADEVQDNLDRLGTAGAADVHTAIAYLEREIAAREATARPPEVSDVPR